MDKSTLLGLAMLALLAHTVQGDCDISKADVCVAEQGGAPKTRTDETDAQMCGFAKTFLRCIYAACDSTPYPKKYQDAVNGLKKGMASAGIECGKPFLPSDTT
ncbi:uncharacterized protein [Littorina saxatilis]|uniref:uncharacterized protein n=1 Tax=Littorina saxatilis TaxID=31220 RepID=UPI0038B4D640